MAIKISGTTVIDDSRNITNINTVSTGNVAVTGDLSVSSNVGIGTTAQTDMSLYIEDFWTAAASRWGEYAYVQDSNTSMSSAVSKYGVQSVINNRNQNKSSDGLTTYLGNYRAVVGDAQNGSTSSGGNAFASELIGGNFRSYQYANGAGSNGINVAVGSRNQVWQYGSGVILNAYGTQAQISAGNNSVTGNINDAYATYSSITSNTASTIANGYLFYGSHAGATTTNKWGVYVTGETKNYLSGNVGIGTIVPTGKIHVVGNDTSVPRIYTNSTNSTAIRTARENTLFIGAMADSTFGYGDGFGPKMIFRTGQNELDGFGAGAISTVRAGADNTHDMRLSTYNAGTESDVMTLAGNGNIGIGNTVPTNKLSVNGNTFFGDLVTLRGYTGGTVGSLVNAYNKTLVIGGPYNQTYNTGNSVLLHIADYDNDAGANVYPVYIEDENNVVDFFLYGGNNGTTSTKIAYLGGNLGVGNTAPTNKLSVNGTTYLGGNVILGSASVAVGLQANGNYGTSGQVLTSNGTATYWATAAAGVNTAAQYAWTNTHVFNAEVAVNAVFRVTNSTANVMFAAANGSIGIGTTTLLNSAMSLSKDPVIIGDGNYYGGGLYWDSAWKNTVGSQGGWVIRNSGGQLAIFTGPANGVAGSIISAGERLRIDSSGNTGIGNTTPASKLHVYSGSGTGVISQIVNNNWAYLANTNANNSSGIWMTSSGSGQLALRDTNANLVAITASGGSAIVSGNVSADAMFASNWFRSTGTTGWYSQDYAGGIYMNDTTQVRVYNNKRFWCGAFAGSVANGNDTSQLQLQNAGGTGDGDVAAISFHCANYYGMKLHLRADGYFGWGGWSASAWRFYQALSSGDVTAAGNITAYSDIRLKENITPLENSLDKIKKLNGVRFTWKDLPEVVGAPGKADFGILAHEVEAVAPELISPSVHDSPDGDPYKTVAYDKLAPLLIEAVKDLSSQIEYLQKELKKLKGE